MSDQKLGVYIHYPFCQKICPYCDFNVYQSSLSRTISEEKLFECYKRDLLYFKEKIKIRKIESIYFGGGTPSLMSPNLIEKIIKLMQDNFKFDNLEITLEANPTNFEVGKFKDFALAGINRLSLGVQSFDDRELAFLGREHDKQSAIRAIEEVDKIFKRYTFDIIYGLPNQTIDQLNKNLEIAIKYAKYHISCYSLTIEEGTPFGRFVKQGRMKEKTSDEMADFMEFAWSKLETNGFNHYEISNFEKGNNLAIHNQLYWNYQDYIGIGTGAHGRLFYKDRKRYSSVISKSLKKWLDGNFLEEELILSDKDIANEIIIASLRSFNGIDINDIKNRFNIDILNYINLEKLKKFKDNSMVIFLDGKIKSTKKGMMLLDGISKNLIKDLEESL